MIRDVMHTKKGKSIQRETSQYKGRQINTKGDKSTQRETNQHRLIQHWETEMQSESLHEKMQLIYTSVTNHYRIY